MAIRIVLECAGAFLVLYGMRQVFRDIFHPTRSGSLSDWIGRFYSKLLRRTRYRSSAGPLALVTVIVAWVLLLTVGFALIYSGVLSGGFVRPGYGALPVSWPRTLFRAMYISLGAFDTFETFDLVPSTDWLRLAVALEGLLGICMITASVSWTVLLYPALARSRWFAREVSLLLSAEEQTGVSSIAELGSPMLLQLARHVLEYRIDLVLFPILLNFFAMDEASTVPYILPELLRIAGDAGRDDRPDVRLAGAKLQLALDDLAETIASRILDSKSRDPGETFRAFKHKESA